ncbi:ATP-binding cassette domain-containing protein [Staphylococcus gallinarum]|uniref:ABC transporter ATP-binding protein n=1 Tax=Staphylococcus gallinarum TaxID=1293 RepID=A0A418HK64_STAGA|nr:ABC transporter ATP-binding protein [Staphylococcus gallinarum]MCD8827221.1 ABC transporter ATP-binding protein [Staphylococcus gallinarum]RIL40973.1 ABC transporter ATP-binding protein [Staphylococcus gallinarum]RIO92896.1 ABC transporter ATP-binding protein [Staphylococcus gallinarum]
MNAIETNNLTKNYQNKTVVNNVNLQVKEGKVFGFLGHNGAGKSTFINMITGLNKPSKGKFKLHINNKSEIGVLPDYSSFYDNMTGKKHIKFFCRILGVKCSSNEIKELFKSIGLENGLNLKVKKYSFGMKKKLGIIQAIINKPKILFLDEPTSGVDANSILSIHALIRKIAQSGTTIFITSHNLDEIQKLCDEIAIMNQGHIEIQGDLEELRRKYEDNLSLEVHHTNLNKQQVNTLIENLENLDDNILKVKINGDCTHLNIKEKSIIPEIVRLYIKLDIDVFKVNLEELSLEDIFLKSSKK